MRGAVVVASLLSQLSQQCGAALVRVRDEMAPYTTFSRVVARRAVVPSRVVAQAPHMRCWARLTLCANVRGGAMRNKQYRS